MRQISGGTEGGSGSLGIFRTVDYSQAAGWQSWLNRQSELASAVPPSSATVLTSSPSSTPAGSVTPSSTVPLLSTVTDWWKTLVFVAIAVAVVWYLAKRYWK